jgi:hypothetical protein
LHVDLVFVQANRLIQIVRFILAGQEAEKEEENEGRGIGSFYLFRARLANDTARLTSHSIIDNFCPSLAQR